MPPIYLDYNATTPILAEVAEAMKPFLTEFFGNPSSSHWYGQQTKKAIENARRNVAHLIGCSPDEIVFTSGGSESNNYAIKGIAFKRRQKGNHIITSKIEHPAVLEVCTYLEEEGYRVSYVPVDADGVIDLDVLEKEINTQTILITVMHANNEVGTIQPIADIARIARQHDIIFHTDAAQSVGKIPLDVKNLDVDLLSVAGHKLYAPKGIGALYIKRGIILTKLIHGADHEQNLRAGTENILEIVGLGKACEVALQDLEKNMEHMRIMRDKLQNGLLQSMDNPQDIRINGHAEKRLPNTLSISFANIEANTLLAEIQSEVAASAGAACHAEKIDISLTLEAMAVPTHFAMGTLRFSTGRMTTKNEIERAIQVVASAVNRLGKTSTGEEIVTAVSDKIRLTQFTHGLGCACKLRAQALEEVLRDLPPMNDPHVLVSTGTTDDAAVYRIRDDLAIVQSVDFFTPIVDNPFDFGRVAAANSLSDIYAMGAKPVFALNIVGFPSNRLPLSVLKEILAGAQKVAAEAGILILGGHTVDDTEPKFGLAVSGFVHPDKVITNAGAQVGDALIVTKPIGTGILTTALKRGLLENTDAHQLVESMAQLNNRAAEIMTDFGIHACTDVSGFGLLGHLKEMTTASGVNVKISASQIPLIQPVEEMARSGIIPGGTENNLKYLEPWIEWSDKIARFQKYILCDAQTSGGLIISVSKSDAQGLLENLIKGGVGSAAIFGEMVEKGRGKIVVETGNV